MASIAIRWMAPIPLRYVGSDTEMYSCDLNDVPAAAGVYLFGRLHGRSLDILYVGESLNMQWRVGQHLASVPLMMALWNAGNGRRYLHVGKLHKKPGQDRKTALQRAERALIRHALENKCSLVNDKGTKTPFHEITFHGNRQACSAFGKRLRLG